MCQPIIEFCHGSTRLLLFAGAFVIALLAIALGYTSCTNNALLSDISPEVAQTRTNGHYLQLAAALFLSLIAILSCIAAHYDNKHSIRALASLSALTCIFAVAAVVTVPTGVELAAQLQPTLEQAGKLYNFTKEPAPASMAADSFLAKMQKAKQSDESLPVAEPRILNRTQRDIGARLAAASASLSSENATLIWDSLQARGCCGLLNATATWKAEHLPKSCCAEPKRTEAGEFICKEADDAHKAGCLRVIESTSVTLIILLALIALANLYLALIAGISVYRTIHYSEASQGGAYT